MEEWERDLIKKNYSELIKNTKCTSEFLSFFYEKGILGCGECQLIASKVVDTEKAVEFYKTIETRTNAFQILLDGLKKYLQTGAKSLLESSSSSTAKKDISFDEVPPVQSFTGRTKELEQLHQMVLRSQGAERVAVVSQVTSVSGLGGIGKTQLAREYVRLKGKEFDGNVLWMNAESEESLTISFQRFAKEKLNLPTKDRNGREIPAKCIAEAVYKYFGVSKALLVLDNAEKAPWLRQFMPKVGQTPALFILITSREKEWDRGMEVLQLDGLTEEDAVKLIQQELEIVTNVIDQMEDIRKLAQTLECFPLALQQAIAYIVEQQVTSEFTVKDYLDEFSIKQQELLNYIEEDGICDPNFTTTTATTWSITFDKIKKDKNSGWLASLILNVVAYLGADNIKRDLFYLIPSVKTDTQFSSVNLEQVNTAVRLLVRYSLLNGREKQSFLSVHRLVQAVTQHQLARDGKEEHFLEIAIQLLQGNDENENFPAENIGHALIVWRHAFKSDPIIQGNAKQINQILWEMRKVGQHNEGIRFGNEALEAFKPVFGNDDEKIFWIQRTIGMILKDQGYNDKAVKIFQNIHSKANSLLGKDSRLSLLTKENLAIALHMSGNSKEGQEILREVLEKNIIIYGDNHLSTLATEVSYGVMLVEVGKLSEAEEIFQRILKIYVEKEGKNSTKVLHLQNNLSSIYSKHENFKKTLQINREVYEQLSPVWVEKLDLFALVCFNLGTSLNAVGKYEEALKILEGNIEKIKQRLGSKHPRILYIKKTIGKSYLYLKNYSMALEILESVHQDYVTLFGEDSLVTLLANREVAVTLSYMGQHAEALSRFRIIIPKMETLFEKENWNGFMSKWKYAEAIERSGENFPMALELLLKVKASMMSFVGEELTNHRETCLTNQFIEILNKIGKLDNSMAILEDILPKAKLLLGEDCEFYLQINENLGHMLLYNEKNKEAQEIFKEVLTKKEMLFRKDHVSILKCKLAYGFALMKNGNLDEADQIFQFLEEIRSQKALDNYIVVWKLQCNLAYNYFKNKGNYGKSLQINKQLYKKLNPVWNEHIDLFATVCYSFGETLNAVGKHGEALKVLEENIEKIKEQMGSQHLRVLKINREIGRAYESLESYARALENFQSVHQGYVCLSEEDSLDSLLARRDVAITLFLMGYHVEALYKFREIIPKLEAHFGREDYEVIPAKWKFVSETERSGDNFPTAMDFQISAWRAIILILEADIKYVGTLSNHIKVIEKAIKDFDKATSTLKDFLPKIQSIYGNDSGPYLEIKENLGNTLIRNGKYAEAQTILREVLEKRKITLGESHSLTLSTRVSFGMALMDDGKLEEAQDIFQKIIKFYLERGDENNKNMLRSQICLNLISSRKKSWITIFKFYCRNQP